MEDLKIALDWVFNPNHLPLMHAQLATNQLVKFIEPNIDGYKTFPIERLINGEVDIALAPTEHLFYYHELFQNSELVALAPLFAKNSSVFVAKPSSGINRPADFDKKVYATYGSPLELDIAKQMAIFDGKSADFKVVKPNKLDLFDFFLNDNADFCWVFKGYEVALAQNLGYNLIELDPVHFGVPYGYSPLLITTRKVAINNRNKIEAFLKQVRKSLEILLTANAEIDVVTQSFDINDADAKLYRPAFELIKNDFSAGNPMLWGNVEPEVLLKYATYLADRSLIKKSTANDFMRFVI